MKGLRKTVALLLLTALVGAMSAGNMVATATTTLEQIQQTQREKNELENKLNQTQENLEDLKGEHNTLKGELNDLNTQLTQVSSNLADLEDQIEKKEDEIAQTLESLEDAREIESWQYECMVIRVRDMYERKGVSYINAILSKDSFGEMLNVADVFERIAEYDQKKLKEFKDNRELIEEHEALLQQEKIELDNLKIAAEAEKSKVSGLISQTANAMDKYADQISDAEEQAKAYEAEIKQKEDTLEKLQEELRLSQEAANGVWRDISEVDFADGDLYLLANLIYCEAGGEPYEGQVAVGSVVINRVLSSRFPDTVVGVIYQRGQFSPVASGRLELALAANKATERCYRAAEEAMDGVTNVGNCVFFRTPIEGLSGINIGGHVFY